jgi:hypothetical protein
MYRVCVDPMTRDDIAAAAAVHRDLGPSYTDAVSEALVERIGAEIDKRVDARLGDRSDMAARRAASAPLSHSSRSAWPGVILALGSMLIGGITAAGILTSGHGNGAAVALIWIIIGVINVAYARRR